MAEKIEKIEKSVKKKKESYTVMYNMDDVGYHCDEEAGSQGEAEQQVVKRLSEAYPQGVVKIL